MAFGFAVVKFSLFVKQLALVLNRPELVSGGKGYSAIAGVALEVLGALLTLAAYLRYRAVRNEIRTGEFKDSFVLISFLSVTIFLICLLLIFYLSESI
jgi:putative membrane protein